MADPGTAAQGGQWEVNLGGDDARINPDLTALLVIDSLTGLYNRTYFRSRLAAELARAAPDGGLALLLVDLDGFKEINDRHGHRVGDRALQEVSDALRTVCPERGAACRLGGDEFVLLVPSTSPAEAAWLQAEVGHELAQRQVILEEGRLPVRLSGSVGLALAPRDGTNPESLFECADARMYEAKRRTAGQRRTSAVSARDGGRAPLLGRDSLLALAEQNLDAAAAAAGNLLLFTGPAGVGKTRLALEVVEQARARGFAVHCSFPSALAATSSDPLSAVRECVSDLLALTGVHHFRQWAQRWPALQILLQTGLPAVGTPATRPPAPVVPVDPPGYEQIGGALRHVLAEVSRRRPVLWVLDDLTAAGTSLLAILEHLARDLGQTRVMILGTARMQRGDDIRQRTFTGWWNTVKQLPGCQRREVPPLDRSAAAALVRWALDRAISPADLAGLLRAGRGNPLHILRLAVNRATLGGGSDPTADLEGAFAIHLAALSPQVRMVLDAAAVLGATMAAGHLATVVSAPLAAVRQAVQVLVASGWLEAEQDRLCFAHPMAQETVYRRMAPTVRRALHRLVAQTGVDMPGFPPAEVARHAEAGGDLGLAQAGCFRAAEVAEAASAYAEAARHYRQGLHLGEISGSASVDAGSHALKAGELFLRAGDRGLAQELLQVALAHLQSPALRGRALLRLAYIHMNNARFDLFRLLNTECVELLQPLGPSPDLAEALMRQVRAEGLAGNSEGARMCADAALAVARAVADPVAEVAWVAGAGHYLCEAGDFTKSEAFYRLARARLRSARRNRAPRMVVALRNVGFLARRLGHQVAGAAAFRAAARMAAARQELGDYLVAEVGVAMCLKNLDCLAEARDVLQAVQPVVRRGNGQLLYGDWLYLMGSVCLFADDVEGMSQLDPLMLQATRTGAIARTPGVVAMRSLLMMARGAAPDRAQYSPTRLLPVVLPDATASPLLLAGAQVQLLHRDWTSAQTLIDAARAHLVDRYESAWVDWLQGRLYWARGLFPQAEAALRRATALGGIVYYRAQAHRDLAELLIQEWHRPDGCRRVRSAQAHLRAAVRLFTRLGNHHELARLQGLRQQLDCAPALRPAGAAAELPARHSLTAAP